MYYLSDLYKNAGLFSENQEEAYRFPVSRGKKSRVHILAMGDVGGFLLTGLMLLGGGQIAVIGIFDLKQSHMQRYEAEMNQFAYPLAAQVKQAEYGQADGEQADECLSAEKPFDGLVETGASGYERLPEVVMLGGEEELFDCDVFVFCASKEVPAVQAQVLDVRMAQYAENKKIIEYYAKLAAERGFAGLFAVVSDPVDPLCKAAYLASGLSPGQLRGFGLGVMNARALYYARKEARYARYAAQGRAFGPHGADLVIADSLTDYDDALSRELTQKVVSENIRIRQIGYKPFMAPAISSGAISILLLLRGEWHYSSCFIGRGEDGAFLGALNAVRGGYTRLERAPLPRELYGRIQHAYEGLRHLR